MRSKAEYEDFIKSHLSSGDYGATSKLFDSNKVTRYLMRDGGSDLLSGSRWVECVVNTTSHEAVRKDGGGCFRVNNVVGLEYATQGVTWVECIVNTGSKEAIVRYGQGSDVSGASESCAVVGYFHGGLLGGIGGLFGL